MLEILVFKKFIYTPANMVYNGMWDADSLKAMKLERGRVRSVLNPRFRSGCEELSMED